MLNIEDLELTVEQLLAMLKFLKTSNSKVKVKGKKCWYLRKCLVTRQTHVKSQRSIFHCKKVISKIIYKLQNDRMIEQKQPPSPDIGFKKGKVCCKYRLLFYIRNIKSYLPNVFTKE